MKTAILFFLNWRNYVLLTLGAIAICLIMSEPTGDNWLAVFTATKLLGVGAGYAFWRLFDRWEKSGKLPEVRTMFSDL